MNKLILNFILFLSTFLLLFPAFGFDEVVIEPGNLSCHGDNSGTVRLEVTGGSPAYFYAIYQGSVVVDFKFTDDPYHVFTGLAAGIYLVGVTDSDNNTFSRYIWIYEPSLLQAGISPDPAVACPGDDLLLNGNSSGGTGDYSHEWTGSGSGYLDNLNIADPVFNSPMPGSWDLIYRVTDGNGCVAESTISVEVPELLQGSFSVTDVTCHGGSNGTVTVTDASGGSGTYRYSLDGNAWQDSPLFGSLAAGTYDIRVMDAGSPEGCHTSIGDAVVNQPDRLNATISHSNVTCHGSSNGSITITGASGGSGVYRYRISGFDWQAEGTFTGVAAGDYLVEIGDAADEGCIVVLDDSYTVSQPEELSAQIIFSPVTCNGASDGTISINNATGGSGSYRYKVTDRGWQNGGLFENLDAGSYVVEIRDALAPGCIVILDNALVLPQPAPLTATFSSSDVTGCFGDTNGWIEISASGSWAEESGNYQYSINGGSTWSASSRFENLGAGIYDLRVRDGDNQQCLFIFDEPVVISQPESLSSELEMEPVTCHGGSDGVIRFINPQGGSGHYQYTVMGSTTYNQTNPEFRNLPAGTYDIRLRDLQGAGCSAIINPAFVLTQPGRMVAEVSKTDVTGCYGNSNGEILVSNPSGGSGNYLFSADNGVSWQADMLFTDLPAGTYRVLMGDADAMDCMVVIDDVEILQPAELAAAFEVFDAGCFGAENGAIEISGATGGSGSYEFSTGTDWQSLPLIGGLQAGSYEVFIRDAASPGCIVNLGTAILDEPAPVSLTILQVNDNICFDAAGGSIEAEASGGTPGYLYILYDGPEEIARLETVYPQPALFEGLPSSASYRVEVTDSRGCDPAVSADITIGQPTPVEVVSVDLLHIDCYGSKTGNIIISASGGTGQLTYILNDGVFSNENGLFTGLPAGTYSVSVVDANFCITSYGEVELLQAGLLGADLLVTDITCRGLDDGILELTGAQGGTNGNYEYSAGGSDWQSSPLFGNLAPGSYRVYIRDTDVPECIVEISGSPAEISEPEQLSIELLVDNVECHGNSSGSIEVAATGGTGDYQYRLDGGSWQDEPVFTGLPSGNRLVEVIDANGCLVTATAEISEPSQMVFVNVISNDESCAGAVDGDINIIISGGTPPYSYSIDGGTTFRDASYFGLLAPGFYPVTVTDAAGCHISFPVPIRIAPGTAIELENLQIDHVSCNGASDGSITASARNVNGTVYSYSLDSIAWEDTGFFDNLPAGDHILYVNDNKLCTRMFVITVTQPDELAAGVQVINTECYGAGGPAIMVAPSGGTAPYNVALMKEGDQAAFYDNVAANETILFEDLVTGITGYEVIVGDSGGCAPVSSGMLSTVVPGELVLDILSQTDAECFGAGNGSIHAAASGGTGPFTFRLYSGSGLVTETVSEDVAQFELLEPGIYNVVLSDAMGCGPVASADVSIGQPDEIVIGNPVISGISCFGVNDGSIIINASGGSGNLTYSINGGAGYFPSGAFTNLSSGHYDILVMDGTGCTADGGRVEIISPDKLAFESVDVEDIITGWANETGSVTINMKGGTPPWSYSIDNGSNWSQDNLFGNLPEGSLEILVSDANQCLADTVVTISRITVVDGSVSLQSPSCNGASNGMIILAGVKGREPFEFSIDSGASFWSSGTFTDLPAGAYDVVIRDADGYIWQQSVQLTEPGPLTASARVEQAWCSNFSADGSIALDVSGGTGSYTYLWSNGEVTRDIGGLEPGTYDVLITDEKGCSFNLETSVGYHHRMEVSFTSGSIAICPGDPVRLETGLQQSGMSVVYSWTASEGIDPAPEAAPQVSPLLPTLYTVTATDENNCYDEASIFVDIHELNGISIGNDTVVYQGSAIQLEAKGGDFVNYEWAPPAGLTQLSGPVTVATVTDDIVFYVYATTEEGCVEYASIRIDIIRPVIPVSGFSPNGDGINDLFDITNAHSYPDITVEVYNRGGQRVFYSRGYSDDQRWDGTYNGRELPVGTYYYVITLNDASNTRPLTGPVTIVR